MINNGFDFKALGLLEGAVAEWEDYYTRVLRTGAEQLMLEQGVQPAFAISTTLSVSQSPTTEDYLVILVECKNPQHAKVVEDAVSESLFWIDKSVAQSFEEARLTLDRGLLRVAKGVFAVEFPEETSEPRTKPNLKLVPFP